MGYWIITGAARGLGYALANDLMQKNHRVFGIGRGRAPQFSTRSGFFQWFEADLVRWEAVEAVLQEIFQVIPKTSWTGQKDELVLVNNAATLGPVGPAQLQRPEAYHDTLAVNLLSPMILASTFARLSRPLGFTRSVLNLSSGAAHQPMSGWAAYGASKAGLEQFARVLALDEQILGSGLSVYTVSPGIIDTDMQAELRQLPVESFPRQPEFVQYHQTGQLVAPAEVARRLVSAFERGLLVNGGSQHVRDLT